MNSKRIRFTKLELVIMADALQEFYDNIMEWDEAQQIERNLKACQSAIDKTWALYDRRIKNDK